MKALNTALKMSCLVSSIILLQSCTGTETSGPIDHDLKITVIEDEDLFGSQQVTLENSLFKAVLRSSGPYHKDWKDGPMYWHNIRSWLFKSHSIDQAKGVGIDCNHFRGNCYKTEMLYDGDDKKAIRMYYHADARYILTEEDIDSTVTQMASEYTIFPNSPVIKVRYITYSKNNGWANAFDIGSPGGLSGKFNAETRVYGQEDWVRELTYHEDPYWQGFMVREDEKHPIDDPEGGSLDYNGHFIMAVGNPENGIGFGRVMPVFKPGRAGGCRIFKLLWDQGFELFPSTGLRYQTERPAHVGYIYLFDKGLDNAITMGTAIADGDMLIGK
jgi:hypothetical protein